MAMGELTLTTTLQRRGPAAAVLRHSRCCTKAGPAAERVAPAPGPAYRRRRVSLHRPSRRKPEPLTRYVGDHTDKLSRVQPMVHDPDERPSGEDLTYGETVF